MFFTNSVKYILYFIRVKKMTNRILIKLSKQFLVKKTPNFRRFLFDKIDFKIKIIGITGGRGAGKTTILQQYAKSVRYKPSQILYVSCDHPAMIDVQLYELADDFSKRGGKLLLIDEIHKIPRFAKQIKAISDFLDLQVIFSGSSAMIIQHESGDLSRRAAMYYLPVLSFREFLALKGNIFPSFSLAEILQDHEDISVAVMMKIKPIEMFNKYLKYGCYPFFKESIAAYPKRLLEVINLTIDSDLSYIHHINSDKRDKLKKILYMLCCTSPYEISKSKLSSEVGLSWPTLVKYLEYMDMGCLVHLVAGGRGHKSIQKPNKLLLNNPNLFQILCADLDIGALRESFFVSQLSYSYQVHYHHKADFIIDEKYCFEIGGPVKGSKQIEPLDNAYLAIDDIESGLQNKIPLWLFGFMY